MKTRIIFISVLIISIMSFTNCQNEADILQSSFEELEHNSKMDAAAELRKNVYIVTENLITNKTAVDEVFEAINKRVFGDEAVLISDLLEPSISILKSVSTATFSSEFLKALNSTNLKSATTSDYNDLLDQIKKSGIQIYWPYHENWDGETLPTITYFDGVNEDENVGIKPDGSEVLVNEIYSLNNPVWIINELESFGGDASQYRAYVQNILKKNFQMKSVNNGPGYITCNNYLSQCIEQTDGLFNGGPDIRIIRVGQIDEWTASLTDDYGTYLIKPSRDDVKYKRWIAEGGYWETEWYPGKKYQVMCIYDEDNTSSTVKLEGSLTGTYKVNNDSLVIEVPFSTDYSFNYNSDEGIIYQNIWGYNWANSTLCYGNNTLCGFVTLKWHNQ